ncbi:hypothetical protein HWV62_25050 [Athelia sp. TMB]|nr:hypothetical protein HWV62_25050 [Athelia sp. TMB]
MSPSFSFIPSLYKTKHRIVDVVTMLENELTTPSGRRILQDFVDTIDDVVGLAPVYGPGCVLSKLAMSSSTRGLIIQFPKKSTKSNPERRLIQDLVLCQSEIQKAAFHMDKLAVSLFLDRHLRITHAIDILSAVKGDRGSLDAILSSLGGELTLLKENIKKVFKHQESAATSILQAAEQAWAACHVVNLPSMSKRILNIPRIDTQALPTTHLSFLAKTLRDADRLDAMKPTVVKNDIKTNFSQKSGKLHLQSDRFKTRIMTSKSQIIRIVGAVEGKKLAPAIGKVTQVEGRAAEITLQGRLQGTKIHSIYTIGKEDLTSAEVQRGSIVRRGLQQTNSIVKQPFVKSIWLPKETTTWPSRPSAPATAIATKRPLNPSQRLAVAEILSDENPVSLIQGPPGTGKTSVIAASVVSMMADPGSRTMWLIAQSNVAVKNIAEKLAEVDFLDFKLLVSKDFHFDWHEHLYEKIRPRVIESPDFPQDTVAAERLLSGARVILCTISMITSSRLSCITRSVLVERVIVDEASQIEIGQYLPLLSRFEKTLKKLVFIGDDKQLAPYGYDDLHDLKSVFEVAHLRRKALFLDTQYRMPAPIGAFISRHVYGGELRTQHNIKALSSCRFKDVPNGKELLMGGSWANQKEVMAVMTIARQHYKNGKPYRIITPYDAQRNQLEKALKGEKLPWEDKCFCVDSFQEKLGFLKNLRRSNVMLSRCKKSMTIVTSRSFIHGVAASSLTTRHFHQNFFDEDIDPITATTVKLSHLTEELLKPFLDNPCDPIGIAPAYAQSDNQLVVLAISNASQILLVELFSKINAERGTFVPSQRKNSRGHTLLQDKLLYRPMGSIYAFDFEPLALSLYKDHGGLRLVNGVDLQSACCPEDRDRQPLMSIKAAIGDDTTIYDDNIRDSFENMIYDPKRTPEIANRAWVSQYLARLGTMEAVFAAAKKIDTQKIPGVTLDLLAKTSRDGQRLDKEKPTQTRKNVVAHWDAQKGQMVAKVDRYQNKMRTSQQQRVRVNVGNDSRTGYALQATISSASGKQADVEVLGLEGSHLVGKVVGTVDIKGREDATNAEKNRGAVILNVLQGDSSVLAANPWVQRIYFPAADCPWPPAFSKAAPDVEADFSILPRLPNSSQLHAVKQMLSSNNDSRLIIIQGHEHLYPQIRSHVIVSDEMRPGHLRKELADCSVILCTLSMLSSPSMSKIVRYNPLVTLVIDEASQIQIGDYMAVLTNNLFAASLRKICFIGDDKQYRMPPFIGNHISKSVYDGKLASNPDHPVKDKTISCYFIDVAAGKQKSEGTSLKNLAELEVVLQIAEQLQEQGKSYRFITPYDAMRTAVESEMKERGLSWADKCFNVDSFQGNEDDYIIISTVRSSDLGFLKSMRRTNVMLTRCKRGMFICSSRAYLEGDGSESLVGEMAAKFGERSWVSMADLEKVLLEL